MGFDVYALKPKTNNENHLYFRANVWYWRPLWSLVEDLCGDQMTQSQQEAGHYNDGITIDNNMSILIGNQLKEALDNGTFKKFKEEHENHKNNIPKDDCKRCLQHSTIINPSCGNCEGSGKTDNIMTAYHYDEELTQEFAEFCLNSGGFEIC